MSLSNKSTKNESDTFVTWQNHAASKKEAPAKKSAPKAGNAPQPAAEENFRPLYQHEVQPQQPTGFTPFSAISQPPPVAEPVRPNPAASPPPDNNTPPPQPSPPKGNPPPPNPEYQKGFQQGEKEGFAKGEKEGYQAGLKQAETQVTQLQNILNQIEGLWTNLIRVNEKQIIDLINRAVEQVVYGIVETDHEVVKRAVLNAFQMIPETVEAVVQIHPDDYDFIEAIKEDLFEEIKGLQNISVIANPAVSPGGCKIESSVGEIDARIEARLADIKKNIVEAYNQKAAAVF